MTALVGRDPRGNRIPAARIFMQSWCAPARYRAALKLRWQTTPSPGGQAGSECRRFVFRSVIPLLTGALYRHDGGVLAVLLVGALRKLLLDGRMKGGEAEGLLQNAVPERLRLLHDRRLSVSGDQQDCHVGLLLADFVGEMEAVQLPRHDNIGDQHVQLEDIRLDRLQGIESIRSSDAAVLAGQLIGKDDAESGFVINDQDGWFVRFHAVRPSQGVAQEAASPRRPSVHSAGASSMALSIARSSFSIRNGFNK